MRQSFATRAPAGRRSCTSAPAARYGVTRRCPLFARAYLVRQHTGATVVGRRTKAERDRGVRGQLGGECERRGRRGDARAARLAHAREARGTRRTERTDPEDVYILRGERADDGAPPDRLVRNERGTWRASYTGVGVGVGVGVVWRRRYECRSPVERRMPLVGVLHLERKADQGVGTAGGERPAQANASAIHCLSGLDCAYP